jgi:hypothetical protein
VIRAHDYAMAGKRVPPHARPPRPTITAVAPRIYWQGSAGAARYSIQGGRGARGPWRTLCDRCVSDSSNGWVDRGGARRHWYRVIPYNLDGRAGRPSAPRRRY